MNTVTSTARKSARIECNLALARRVLELESAAVLSLAARLDESFHDAVETLLACSGKVVVCGMGKSGHVGRKIAATMASTGTPSFFVHPAEASHGDLGMISSNDAVVVISYSGETNELLALVPVLKRMAVPMIAITGNPKSTLAREAHTHLDVRVEAEADPLGLAPTSSTTATLALGDALALCLLDARGFTPEDFARSHPGGSLGRRLLIRVQDLMHRDASLPCVDTHASISAAIMEMTRKGLGMTAIVDSKRHAIGILTDGDLRRVLERNIDIRSTPLTEIMTKNPKTIHEHVLAAEAMERMESMRINGLLAVNDAHEVVGALNMHDLFRARVI